MTRAAADAARAAILVAASAFLLAGDGAAGLKALLVLVPALAARAIGVPPALDLTFVLALGTEAIATGLGAYDSLAWGDTLSHLVLPLLSGPVLYVGLARLAGPRGPLAAALLTAVAVVGLGAAWELVEWACDDALGTNYSQGHADTVRDLRNDAIAAVASGLLVALWLSRPSHRVHPRTAERTGA